ncbi:YbdD/YjiX family protein [uncultured Kocuria sp.]|uniref:CstA-like transporter-associated (seleno)protein n=1 Tax=uncultured Kocuria sp. TaxID=259305 RepID=UPI0009E3CE04|nr:YbdD/YjiX family protein [uncultured Kocuria sp.]MCT1368272.1 YbdD/YjiX family protein [Rothia sp. p3-SID1597]
MTDFKEQRNPKLRVIERLRSSAVARFASGVLGADKYERYLDYHRRSGCTEPPLSERQYWRSLTDHQESHPGARCC